MTDYVVSAGQTSSGIVLNAGDMLAVLSGGFAVSATINVNGSETVRAGGRDSGTVVSSGGSLLVSGGLAQNDTVNNGTVTIVSIAGAVPAIGELAFATVNSGGFLFVSAGGIADSDTINTEGNVTVANGGNLNDGTINAGGAVTVSAGGDAFFETVGGSLDVLPNGRAQDDTVIKGGTLAINPAAVMGPAIGGGGPHNMVISGGLLELLDGAAAQEGIDFRSISGGRLLINNLTMPTTTISGLTVGDTFLLNAVNFSSASTASLLPGNVLQVNANGSTYRLNLDPNQNFSGAVFSLSNDAGATLITDGPVLPPTGFFGTPQLVFSGFGVNAGGWTNQNALPRLLGDVNGDGRADIVGFGNGGVYVSFANADGTFQQPFLAYRGFGADAAAGGWSNQTTYPRLLGDVTGNGRHDIVAFGNAGVYVSLANADGTFQAPFLALPNFGTNAAAGNWTSNDTYPRMLADLTGNGRDDIVAFGNNGVYVSLANADGTFQAPFLAYAGFGVSPSAGGWSSQNLYPREVADVTGNGHADIVAFGAEGVFTALGNGDGTFKPPFYAFAGLTPASGGWSSQDQFPRELATTLSGSGADIVGFGGNGVSVTFSNQFGSFYGPVGELSAYGADQGWTSNNLYPRETADVNGDGLSDIVGFGSNGVYESLRVGPILNAGLGALGPA